MFARRKTAKRFNLLLLEEGELYVKDWVATARWPAGLEGNWSGADRLPGRLRLATRSLFFDPDDVRVPIVRLPFEALNRLEAESTQAVALTTTHVTRMRANCEDAPYQTDKCRQFTWVFVLAYARLEEVLPLAHECLAASRLPTVERTRMLEELARAREDAARFDSSRLADFSERLLWEGPATQLTPLVREPGRLAVSDARIYFQPLHAVTGDSPVRSHPLAAVAAVARRRASLRPLGLEAFFVAPAGPGGSGGLPSGPFWEGPSAFFAFRTEADREAVLCLLRSQPALGSAVAAIATASAPPSPSPAAPITAPPPMPPEAAAALLDAGAGGWLRRVTVAWQRARLTNFDYLLYLNLAAGRSFNDLAQWPVFPWVLSDYTSADLDLTRPSSFRDLARPMGAQTEARLADFRRRYRDMASLPPDVDIGGPPFMYGTHYSTPGYVLYWLVRAAPAHMLRLQSGRFDAPDRLFGGIAEAWGSATGGPSDVKELIPEFYMPGTEWLVNRLGLALGVRQSGRAVGDVQLPPWASGPEDFLAKQRAALECPHVSAHLHEWIDLIFGYKQTGPAAVDADNVFHHLTYEGAVDVAKVEDPVELRALETQINEFGQTPRQLFTTPHPPRLVLPPAPAPSEAFGGPLAAAGGGGSPSAAAAATAAAAAAAAGGGGTARLQGGGEDAGGRALALSLLHAVLEAAAPEVASEAEAASVGAEAPTHTVAGRQQQQQQQRVGAGGSGGATSSNGKSGGSGATKLEGGGLEPITGEDAASPLAIVKAPLSSAAAAAAATAAAAGASAAAASATSRLSLAWVQEQFARGLAVGSASNSSRGDPQASVDSLDGPPPVGQTSCQTSAAAGAGGTPRSPSSPAPAAAGAAAPPNSTPPPREPWPAGLHERLLLRHSTRLQREPLTAVALAASPLDPPAGGGTSPPPATAAAADPGFACAVGHGGLLRVLGAPGLAPLRSSKLQCDLLSAALLPVAPPRHAHSPAATTLLSGLLSPQPAAPPMDEILLAGTADRAVLAFAPRPGRLLGRWDAHEDAVATVLPLGRSGPGGSPGRLLTGSWDCSLKVWDLSEGRAPWDTTTPLAVLELRDFASGVWAAAAGGSGQLVVAGTEEGMVAAWDLRSGREVWSVKVCDDYVGGLALLPGGAYVAAAAADGAVRLLEWRRGGAVAVTASCGAPLRCCASDGRLLIAGGEAGQLHVWDVAAMTGQPRAAGGGGGFSLPGPDGFYPSLTCGSRAPVNAVAVCASSVGSGECWVAAAQDDGTLSLFAG